MESTKTLTCRKQSDPCALGADAAEQALEELLTKCRESLIGTDYNPHNIGALPAILGTIRQYIWQRNQARADLAEAIRLGEGMADHIMSDCPYLPCKECKETPLMTCPVSDFSSWLDGRGGGE